MIEHLFKWLVLVPLLNHNIERATYAFMDNMFNRFGIVVEIFINQSMEFHEKFQKLHEKTLINHCMTS
jgi:hemoglobin-like flavoprotein